MREMRAAIDLLPNTVQKGVAHPLQLGIDNAIDCQRSVNDMLAVAKHLVRFIHQISFECSELHGAEESDQLLGGEFQSREAFRKSPTTSSESNALQFWQEQKQLPKLRLIEKNLFGHPASPADSKKYSQIMVKFVLKTVPV
jgi:hypothetical protein